MLIKDSAAAALARSQKASEVALVVEGNNMFLRPNIASVSRQHKLDSWDKWVLAFHTFMAIYLMQFPFRAIEMLRYADIVHTAAVQFQGTGWRLYDEQFRIGQEMQPSRSWAELDADFHSGCGHGPAWKYPAAC